jgi:hypothetical protein
MPDPSAASKTNKKPKPMKTLTQTILILVLVLAGSYEGKAQKDKSKNVLFISSPPGATLIVDGVMHGQTPQSLSLSHGYHQVTIFHKGYLKLFNGISVSDSTNMFKVDLIPITLNPGSNSDYIEDIDPAPVTFDPMYFEPTLSSSEKKYANRFTASIVVASTTAIAAIASHGVANNKYQEWKNGSPENRDQLKKQVQILDAVSIASLTLCLASTYSAFYYSKQLSKIRQSGSISATILPMHSGAGISFKYTLP